MPTPATVEISESNGAGEVVTDGISNINLGGADIPNLIPANHPIIRTSTVPDNVFCSFWKCLRVHLVSMGDSLLIDTLRTWKASGAYVQGEDLIYTTSGSQGFLTPAKTNLALGPSVAQFPTSDPTVGKIGIGGSLSGNWTDAPHYSNYTIFQTRYNIVAAGGVTPIGPVNQKAIVFAYNES